MSNNLKIPISLILFLGIGSLIGACCGGFLGFFASIFGFDFGIWKVFWSIFWGCLWLGTGVGFLTWIIWLASYQKTR
jgi:hypothetical protein